MKVFQYFPLMFKEAKIFEIYFFSNSFLVVIYIPIYLVFLLKHLKVGPNYTKSNNDVVGLKVLQVPVPMIGCGQNLISINSNEKICIQTKRK